MAFAMATSYSYLFTVRHPRSHFRVPVWVGTHALATTVALLRVEAGRHFWSDVLTGAAVGMGVGLLVPWLHTPGQNGRTPLGALARLYVTPTFSDRSFGVSVGAVW
jgi:membrane-associated phospholipid phosphatase